MIDWLILAIYYRKHDEDSNKNCDAAYQCWLQIPPEHL